MRERGQHLLPLADVHRALAPCLSALLLREFVPCVTRSALA